MPLPLFDLGPSPQWNLTRYWLHLYRPVTLTTNLLPSSLPPFSPLLTFLVFSSLFSLIWGRQAHKCWSAVMTERQQGDYCAILSRVLSGAWKYKVTILHDNPQVSLRSLLFLWSSCHASRCGSCFWKVHFKWTVQTASPLPAHKPPVITAVC